MTTGDITKHALRVLDLMGFEAWRNNNLAVKGRKFIGKRGVSDIIGFDRLSGKGTFMLCEVKNEGDELSEDQIKLLDEATAAGCKCFIARVDKNKGFELIKYK